MYKITSIISAYMFGINAEKLFFVDRTLNLCSLTGVIIQNAVSTQSIDMSFHNKWLVLNERTNCGILIYDTSANRLSYRSSENLKAVSSYDPIFFGSKIHVSIEEEKGDSYALIDIESGTISPVNYAGWYSFSESKLVFDWIKDQHFSIIGLAAINPETGSEVWRFTEKRHLGLDWRGDEIVEEISKVLGIYDNLLWLAINPERIVALNLETGKVEREHFTTVSGTTNSGNYADDDNLLLSAGGVHYLPDEKKLVYFSEAAYCEFDLTSANPQWECHDVSTQFKELELDSVINETVRGNFICFNRTFSSKLGVFDRTQRKIVWHINLKELHPNVDGVKKIDMTETRLYALDYNQNLFVFERDFTMT